MTKRALKGQSASFPSTACNAQVIVSPPWAEVHLLADPSTCPSVDLTLRSDRGDTQQQSAADGEKCLPNTTAVHFSDPPEASTYALEVAPDGADGPLTHVENVDAERVVNEDATPGDAPESTITAAYAPVTFEWATKGHVPPEYGEEQEELTFGDDQVEPGVGPILPDPDSTEPMTDGWVYIFRAETTEQGSQVYVSEVFVDSEGRYAVADFGEKPESGTQDVAWVLADGGPGTSVQNWVWTSNERLSQSRAERIRQYVQRYVEEDIEDGLDLPPLSFSREADGWTAKTDHVQQADDGSAWTVRVPDPFAIGETLLNAYEEAVRDLLTWQERVAPVKQLHGIVEQLREADAETFEDDVRGPLGSYEYASPSDAAEEWKQQHFRKHQAMMAACENAAQRLVRLLRHDAFERRLIDRVWIGGEPKTKAVNLYGDLVRFLSVTEAGKDYLQETFKDSRLKRALANYRAVSSEEDEMPVAEARPPVPEADRTAAAETPTPESGPARLKQADPPGTMGTTPGDEAADEEPLPVEKEEYVKEKQQEVAEKVITQMKKAPGKEQLMPPTFNPIDQFFSPSEKTAKGLFTMIEAFSETITKWVEREAVAPVFGTLTVIATKSEMAVRITRSGIEIGQLVQIRRYEVPVVGTRTYTYLDKIEVDNWSKKVATSPTFEKVSTCVRWGLGIANLAVAYRKIPDGLSKGGIEGNAMVMKQTAVMSQFALEELAKIAKKNNADRVARTLAKGVRWTGWAAVVADGILGIRAVGERLHKGDYDGAVAKSVQATGSVMLGLALTEAAAVSITGGLSAGASASILGWPISWLIALGLVVYLGGYVLVSLFVDTDLELWLAGNCIWGTDGNKKLAQKALRLVRTEGVPKNDETLVKTVIEQAKAFYRNLYGYSVRFGGQIDAQVAPAATLHTRDAVKWTAPRVPIEEEEEWLDASDWIDRDSIPVLSVRLEREHARAPFPPTARLTAEVEIRRDFQTIWTGRRTVHPSGPDARRLYLPDVQPQSGDFDPSTSETLVLRFYDQKHRGRLQEQELDPAGIPVENLEAEFQKDGPFILEARMILRLSEEAEKAETFQKGALLKLSQSEWDEGLNDGMPVLQRRTLEEGSSGPDSFPSGTN